MYMMYPQDLCGTEYCVPKGRLDLCGTYSPLESGVELKHCPIRGLFTSP